MALGELLIEETGTITNIRVLPATAGRKLRSLPHCYWRAARIKVHNKLDLYSDNEE